LVNITDKAKCSGRSVCAAICPINCIEMEIDSEGFAYPGVN
jgi:Pyruvate/2-oxoacid:ferredoxin oxidoreductase delta subunit